MNFEELQKAWAQQRSTGEVIDTAKLRDGLASEVRARSRRILRVIGVAIFVFAIGWGVALAAHFTGIKPFNAVTLTTFVVGSLFDLALLGLALRALRRMHQEALGMGDTLADALRTSHRAVELQLRDCTLFGYALTVVFVLGLGTTLVHYATGNLPRVGALANVALIVAFVAGIGATLRRYYRKDLLPRREQLQRDLAELRM